MFAPFFSAFSLAGLVWLGRPRVRLLPFIILLLSAALLLVSCGGGLQGNAGGGSGSPGTPAGAYNINVTATCNSITHTSQVTLSVTP
jgi:hypothetical protein